MRALLSSRLTLSLSLFLFAARAIAITMRYEVDIVTNVMEPGARFFGLEVLKFVKRKGREAAVNSL